MKTPRTEKVTYALLAQNNSEASDFLEMNKHAEILECELNAATTLNHRLAMALANLNEDASKEIAEYQVPSDVKAALDAYTAQSNDKLTPGGREATD
jgi:uncharacterized protein YdeI (YjbR/CyaY-like superfamily)